VKHKRYKSYKSYESYCKSCKRLRIESPLPWEDEIWRVWKAL